MKPEHPLVLALDIGTSSVRAVAYDAHAKAVPDARAQRSHDLQTDDDGAAELDPDLLIQNLAECVDEVLRTLGDFSGQIRAVGCCTMWHSMIGVDEAGRATTPLYTWADSRSSPAAKKLKEELDPATVHERTGCAIHPSYFPARLLWLRQADPNLFRRVHRWVSPGEYVYLQFFGRADCSISMASGTGLFDQNARRWDPEMLSAAGITDEKLSPLKDADAAESGLREPWRSRWPSLAAIPWLPAIGDGAASNLGSGCATADSVAINLGTSGAIRTVLEAEKIRIPPELWCYRLDGRRFVIGAAFSDGGEVYSWMRETLNLKGTDEELDSILLELEPDSHGLTFLPFMAGERSLGWRPDARATLHGISRASQPLDILHASMEAVGLRFLLVWNLFQAWMPNIERVVASGGAMGASRAWQQMIANALGHPIIVTGDAEASSRGAAILALKGAGILQIETDLAEVEGDVVEPDPRAHEIYRAALDRQQDLYYRLGGVSPESPRRFVDAPDSNGQPAA